MTLPIGAVSTRYAFGTGQNIRNSKNLKSVPKMEFVKPKAREILGGDLLAQSLKALGCEVAFGLHGGHLDAFLVGAMDAGIKLIDTRHETTAVQAAEGYAKVKGRVGVCFVTANSG